MKLRRFDFDIHKKPNELYNIFLQVVYFFFFNTKSHLKKNNLVFKSKWHGLKIMKTRFKKPE